MYQATFPLTMQEASAALAEGLRAIEAGETSIDLATATAVDSAGVAILLAWRRAALARGAKFEFHNLPPVLCSLAALYGVEDLLSLDSEGALPPH